jgi:hypothetical protein
MARQRGLQRHSSRPWSSPLGVAGLLALGCANAARPNAPSDRAGDAAANARRSGVADRQHVALTVYNSSFALVREERRLSLGKGRVALAYEDVSAHVQPATVHLRSLDAPDGLTVLEQNYRYDLLTPETLLEKYVGRHVTLARTNDETGSDERRDAELLSVQNGPVLRVGGEILTNVTDRFIFPELPASLLQRPTLVWLLDSARDEQRVEVTYLTSDLSWHADYVLVLSDGAERGDLSSWVTLDNQSGTSFPAAELKLVAGNVQRVPPPAPPPPPMMDMEQSAAANGGFQQEALFEYHLYALGRPADVLDKEQKQISLLEARGARLVKKLVLRGNDAGFRNSWGSTIETQKVKVLVELKNEAGNGLGMPLPAGVVRVYQADSSGAQQFVGEDSIEHTPRDESIELELGESFDVIGERRQLTWRPLARCGAESSWQIELRNHKDDAARVRLIEPAGGDYQVTSPSHPVVEQDAQSFQFEVDVPARGAVKVTYQLRVRWC